MSERAWRGAIVGACLFASMACSKAAPSGPSRDVVLRSLTTETQFYRDSVQRMLDRRHRNAVENAVLAAATNRARESDPWETWTTRIAVEAVEVEPTGDGRFPWRGIVRLGIDCPSRATDGAIATVRQVLRREYRFEASAMGGWSPANPTEAVDLCPP